MRRLVFLLLLGVACARSEARSEFLLRVAVVGPLAPLHPLLDATGTLAAHDLVFQTMLTPDAQGTLTSQVLERWERVDNQRYRVQIKPDLHFSDGSPVRAEDVVASLAARKLQCTVRGDWIEVSPGSASFPVEPMLLFSTIHKQTPNGFVGTGPFRLVAQTEKRIALDRVTPARGRINRVELLAFPTPRDVFTRTVQGEANAAFALDGRQLELFDGIPTLKPVRSVSPHAVTIFFNTARLGAATRRRLRAALPVESIAAVFGGGSWTEAKPAPERRELPPGKPLEILVPQFSTALDRAALAVKRALGNRGGKIAHVDVLEGEAREKAGNFDIVVRPHLMWPPAVIALSWQTGAPANFAHYSNSRVDAALDRGDLAAATAELEADAPFVEVCRRERFGLVDARIKNPRLGWWGILDTLPDWEIEE